MRPSRCARSVSVSASSAPSRWAPRRSTRWRSSRVATCVARSCTTCASCAARRPRSARSASPSRAERTTSWAGGHHRVAAAGVPGAPVHAAVAGPSRRAWQSGRVHDEPAPDRATVRSQRPRSGWVLVLRESVIILVSAIVLSLVIKTFLAQASTSRAVRWSRRFRSATG